MSPIPLKWYEDLLLSWLIKSPRIDRIVVYQNPGPELPYLEAEDFPEDDPELIEAWMEHLERAYQGPSTDPRREV